MAKKNIAVLVSGGGTNLQSLLDSQEKGMFGESRITCVVSSKPGVYALQRAKQHGVDAFVLARGDYPDIAAYSSRNIVLRDGKIRSDTLNENILSAAKSLAELPPSRDD